MKNRLFSIIDVLTGYVRRRRLDAVRRRTSENGMWQITECPDFLDPNRRHPSEVLGKDGGGADGRMCFLHDGVRAICLGSRK